MLLSFLAPNAAPEIQSSHNLTSSSIFIRWSRIPRKNIRGILQGFVLNYRHIKTGNDSSLAPQQLFLPKTMNSKNMLNNLKDYSYRIFRPEFSPDSECQLT